MITVKERVRGGEGRRWLGEGRGSGYRLVIKGWMSVLEVV